MLVVGLVSNFGMAVCESEANACSKNGLSCVAVYCGAQNGKRTIFGEKAEGELSSGLAR